MASWGSHTTCTPCTCTSWGSHAQGGTSGTPTIPEEGHGRRRELAGSLVSHYETTTATMNGPHGFKRSEERPRLDPQPLGRSPGSAPTNTHTTHTLQVCPSHYHGALSRDRGRLMGKPVEFHGNSHSWDGVSWKRPPINLAPLTSRGG